MNEGSKGVGDRPFGFRTAPSVDSLRAKLKTLYSLQPFTVNRFPFIRQMVQAKNKRNAGKSFICKLKSALTAYRGNEVEFNHFPIIVNITMLQLKYLHQEFPNESLRHHQ